jgi:hypothetical protein
LSNNAARKSVPKLVETRELTHTFHTDTTNPANDIPTINNPTRHTTPKSRTITPSSTIRAINHGCTVSANTPPNTNTGQSKKLHRYFLNIA